MNQRPLWKLSVVTTPEAEEAVAEMLGTAFGEPAVSYTDLESGTTTVTAYFAAKPDWSRSRQADLRAELKRIAACGLKVSPGRLALGKVRREDWAESWKRHFKPLEIGSALLIRPSWSQRRPRKGQAEVVLDPGLSFGTGQHPTTGFCLQQLVACRKPEQAQTVLDIGTGSGILAIAAARLGYQPVEAFDFDPEAVRVAQENTRKNGVAQQIELRQQDVTGLPRRAAKQYAVVCANLMANLLLAERDRILARVQPKGTLVLAGILKTEFGQVQQAYEAAGWRLVASKAEKEWRSGSFRKSEREKRVRKGD